MTAEVFTKWLNSKLRELNTDESVFGTYIVGILDGDETEDEKAEALQEILSEIINSDLDELIASILNKWVECHPKTDAPAKPTISIDVNEQLAKYLEAQTLQTTTKERQMTDEERRIKAQILAQYSETPVSDEEADDADDEVVAEKTSSGLEKNTNVQDVQQLLKEKREQARIDSAAKKQKDKEDREKQKQMREEKKEKRKTVKGERRR